MRTLLALVFLLGCADAGPPEGAVWVTTTEHRVEPGQEKYQCFTTTLEAAMVVQRIDYERAAGVHHLLLARTLAPEPEGAFECNVLLKTTWVPLFGSGSESTALELPSDTGFVLPAGTQLLVQLHLLNAASTPVSDHVRLTLHEASDPDVVPAGVYAFGSTEIGLPPRETTDVVSDCVPSGDLDIIAVLPHMHYLGSSLSFEVGADETSLRPEFQVDSWNFDRQFIRRVDLTIPAGSATRTTCRFENDTDRTVEFGESSFDEMCFFVTFVRGATGLDGCIQGDTGVVEPPGGEVCEAEPNEMGIGTPCTEDGGECPEGLSCTADLSDGEVGSCVRFGCRSNEECGSSATCCAPAEGGGVIKLCLPDTCVPSDCEPV